MEAVNFDHLFVITGGPGSGKSALIDALVGHGISTMPEAGRAIIQDQVAIGGDALPWSDRRTFAELVLGWDIRSYRAALRLSGPVIFDRGVPDVLGYLRLSELPIPPHVDRAAQIFRYHFDAIRATYEGTLSESKNSLEGTLTQGSRRPLNLERATEESSWLRTPHTIQFITVEDNVKLEIVDWGGSGRALILLAGGNNHAHGFDKFAPKLTGAYRVYGITRRGSGASSASPPTRANYAADRLGDDILAVIAALKLDWPILVGHSLAGQELSSVGSRHPEKVGGLIYLDAGYSYAYDPSPSEPPSARPQRQIATVQDALRAGGQKYTRIDVPILAIYALPHERGITDPAKRAEADARDLAFQGAMAKAFEKGLPSAPVIWLAHADHYVFRSNEADVLREMNAFIAGLPLKSSAVRRN